MGGETTTDAVFAGWKLVATILFVLINGFFVAAEFALVKARPSRMESLAHGGSRRAKLVMTMLGRLDLYLSACQMGITIASLILGWLAEPAVASLIIEAASALGADIAQQNWVHPLALGLALLVITMLHMTVGEQAPKMWSIQKAETAILVFVLPLYLFAVVFKPLIWVINWISNGLVRLTGVSPGALHEGTYDLAELRAILAAAARSGQLSPRQRLFSENVLGLANLQVRHVMVPRTDVAYLSTEDTLEENLKVVRETGHSRFPLADPDLDNVKGLVLSRALLGELLDGKSPDLQSLARELPAVPDRQPLSRLIFDFQRTQTHCALVVDEHGTTIGLAFLEDALEEIVGPIHDEFDEQVARLSRTEPNVIELAGSYPLPDAALALGMEFEDETDDTIGGLVVSRLGRLPRKGEQLEIGPYRVTVLAVSRRRVARIRFEKVEPADLEQAGT